MPQVITIHSTSLNYLTLSYFSPSRTIEIASTVSVCILIMGQWVTGTDPWPMWPSQFVDLFSPWPTDPLSALTLRSLALSREFGASIPQRVGPGDKTPQISHKNWGKELISTWISWKCAWFSSPCFRRTPLWNGRPWVRWFSFFRKSSQPETNHICHPFTWLHACCI